MATVLCSGGESVHTRQLLLESAGFEVVTANSSQALLTASRLPDVGAVILDSRANIPDLAAVARNLKSADPALPVILVTDSGIEDVPEPGLVFDRVVSRLDGPAALLATLREITAGADRISNATTCSARANLSRTRQLRRGMMELRGKLHQLRCKLSTTKHLIRKT